MESRGDPTTWQQMGFRAADGHREVLWVEPDQDDTYRVLNVPVWLYGISVGTTVQGRPGDQWLEYVATVRESRGATVRVYLPRGAPITPASRLYLERIIPDCRDRQIAIGPATFFDPRVVAVHIHDRDQQATAVASYLDELVDAGIADLWEFGDPDTYPPEDAEESAGDELVHPQPTTQRHQHF